MKFIQTSIEKVNEQFMLHGDLTIKDVTNPVTFTVTYNGHVKSPWEAEAYGFSCKTTINRKDFGLTYNAAIETGGLLIDELVTINVELQLNILA